MVQEISWKVQKLPSVSKVTSFGKLLRHKVLAGSIQKDLHILSIAGGKAQTAGNSVNTSKKTGKLKSFCAGGIKDFSIAAMHRSTGTFILSEGRCLQVNRNPSALILKAT